MSHCDLVVLFALMGSALALGELGVIGPVRCVFVSSAAGIY